MSRLPTMRLPFTACLVFLALPVLPAFASKPPAPARHTAEGCKWVWKEGAGIRLWVESCNLATGKWRIDYDPVSKRFVQSVDGRDDHPVIYVFDKARDAGLDSLLPMLRKAQLIKDSDDCVFEADPVNKPGRGRLAYQIVPTGQLKVAFDALPKDEVPDPPCGELGLLPDAVGYFMVDPKRPDKILYLMLGQDEPMFAPETITFD